VLFGAGIACAGIVQAAAPVANDDSYQTGQGQMMSIAAPGVLGNDSDADMDALTASVVSNPLSGVLTLNADGSFTYNPDSDFYGTDSFSYAVSDGSASDQAVVSLTVTSSYAGGGGGGGGGYGSGGAPSPAALALLALAALYPRGLKLSKRRAISP
jgi:VCBS repeat-containing protein